jgi:hypothetical protein
MKAHTVLVTELTGRDHWDTLGIDIKANIADGGIGAWVGLTTGTSGGLL